MPSAAALQCSSEAACRSLRPLLTLVVSLVIPVIVELVPFVLVFSPYHIFVSAKAWVQTEFRVGIKTLCWDVILGGMIGVAQQLGDEMVRRGV